MNDTVLASIRLTEYQAEEVSHGLDCDDIAWGGLRWTGNTAILDVYDFDAAIWRVASGRDICLDNRRLEPTAAGDARKLQALIDRLVAAAGGPANLDAETRAVL